jgi:hypothetical protein
MNSVLLRDEMVFQFVSSSVSMISALYEKSYDPKIVKYITAWWMNREQEPTTEELENLLSFLFDEHSGNFVSIEDVIDSNVFEPEIYDNIESENFTLNTALFG